MKLSDNWLFIKKTGILLTIFALVFLITKPTLADEVEERQLVEGVDYDIVEIFVPFETNNVEEKPRINQFAYQGWSIRDVLGPYTSYRSVGGTVSGQPGQTISISQSSGIDYSVTTSSGISVADVSAAIGTSVSRKESFTLSSSLYIPYTYNGKNVSSATLRAQAVSHQYSYQIYYYGTKVTNGTANSFRGLKYIHTFYY